jgi:predicted esterase
MGAAACGQTEVVSVRRLVSILMAVALLALGCGGDDTPATDRQFAVGTRSFEFVDDTRPTPAFGGSPELPTRTLVTEVWYPAEGQPGMTSADAPPADGSFPLIVFNHGQQGEPQQYAPAFQAWARAGYVVAAPRHPITVRGGPGGQYIHDAEGEIGDVPFVITKITDELPDLVTDDRVAVAGHSSGALVALAVGFGECCHERVDAVLLEGLPGVEFDGGQPGAGRGTPVMFIHGTNDTGTIDQVRVAYAAAAPPKFLYLPEGGDHSAMYRDGSQALDVAGAARAFFDFALKDRDDVVELLRATPGIQVELGDAPTG